MRQAVKVVVANALGVVLLLGALEGGVRLLVPGITPLGTDQGLVQDSLFGASPGPRPGATGTSNGAAFAADAHGFWRYGDGSTPGRSAWLFLGDSVTMGIGVAPEATFAGRLAEQTDTLQVLNPSLIGYSVTDYQRVLHTVGGARSPFPLERATVFWCLNDVYGGFAIGDPGTGVRRVFEGVLGLARRHLYTYQWLKNGLFDRPLRYLRYDLALYTPEAEPLRAAVDTLAAMHRWAEARGIAFEVVLLPYEAQLRPDAPEAWRRPQTLLAERLRAAGVPVLDATPALRAAPSDTDDLYLYGDGIHFSAEGHARIARLVAERLGQAASSY